jgi:para-nitrobenzyl esterase
VQAAATPADAALVTGILGEHLGLVPRVESLAELGSATIIKAQRAVAAELTSAPNPARFGQSVVAAQMAFIPVIDGDIVPVHPAVAIHAGMGSGIPLLIGVNSDEYRLFLVPTGVAGAMTDEALEAMAAAMGAPEGITETYRRARPDDTPGDHFAALLSDLFFWLPSFTVAQTRRAQGAVTFAYEFGYSTGPQLRACHAAELGYVFDTLTAAHFGGAEAAQGLAERMHGAWVEFARHGNPGWSDGDGTVMVFTDPHPHLDSDPMTLPRAAWATPMR